MLEDATAVALKRVIAWQIAEGQTLADMVRETIRQELNHA